MRTLELVERLLAGLTYESIPYCHWKSTTNLAASLSGETDLDLLVDEKRRKDCLALLEKLDFLPAVDPWELDLPGICHYFGYDPPSGCLVHVHLHFQLVIGDDLLKNYRLPAEKIFLASAKPVRGIFVPAPEVEFITFVLRMTLKRRLLSILVRLLLLMGNPLSFLKQLLGLKPLPLSSKAQAEFDDLSARVSEETLARTLRDGFPFIAPELFGQCRNALGRPRGRFAWFRAASRLTRALSDHRRLTGIAAVCQMFWQALRLRGRTVLDRAGCCGPAGKVLASGGRIIAFVGGDGAGKTTLVDDTAQWLGRYFWVTKRHLGKPAKGPLWFFLLGLMKVRSLLTGKSEDSFHQAVLYWLVARYRFRTYRQTVRLRQRGTVVLLDRVPLPGSRYMDTPRIAGLQGANGPVFRLMAAWEERWHQRIKADELIVLRLDPKIAAERRPEDDQELLAKRSGEIWHREWPVPYGHIVDASRPLPEVVSRVRSHAWAILGRINPVFELLGPAGSGKSSLAEELRRRFYNLRTTLCWRDGKKVWLAAMIKRLPRLAGGMLRRVPPAHLKLAISTETVIKMLQPECRRRYCDGLPVILEIGPTFHLTFLEKESVRFDKAWLGELRGMLRQSVDRLIFLDAADELLLARINNRSKEHRIKHAPPMEGEKFLADYRDCFRELIGKGSEALPMTVIDTGHLSVAECADLVIREWQESVR